MNAIELLPVLRRPGDVPRGRTASARGSVSPQRDQGWAIDPSGENEAEAGDRDLDGNRSGKEPPEPTLYGLMGGRFVVAIGDDHDQCLREHLADPGVVLGYVGIRDGPVS